MLIFLKKNQHFLPIKAYILFSKNISIFLIIILLYKFNYFKKYLFLEYFYKNYINFSKKLILYKRIYLLVFVII